MRRTLSINRIIAFYGIAFVALWLLRAVSGPPVAGNWFYWSGDTASGLLIALPGFALVIAATAKPSLLFAMRPLLGKQPRPLNRVTLVERITWFTVGLLMMVVGTVFVQSAIRGWIG